MCLTRCFFDEWVTRLLIWIPISSLVLGAVNWLRYGIDLPYFDDWRGYAEGTIGSLEPSYLFRAVNDTLAPVGFALDALAQRYLDGNSLVYQFLSMLLTLGGLLFLQWKLLRKVLCSDLRAAFCLIFALPMLQPGSYWGYENMAYHQALPLVFIWTALWWALNRENHKNWVSGLVLFTLGLLAGFTYISGAFGVLAAALAILLFACFFMAEQDSSRASLRSDALWFMAAGGASAAIQVWKAIVSYREVHERVPFAVPLDGDFWWFYAGKVGRALLLESFAQVYPALALGIVILVCMAALAIVLILLIQTLQRRLDNNGEKLALICFTIFVLIAVYLAMVSGGRANYRDPGVEKGLDIFVFGFGRFHFFWATLLWPWLVAALVYLVRGLHWRGFRICRAAGAVIVMATLAGMFAGGAFAHAQTYQAIGAWRQSIAACLMTDLQSGRGIHCQGLRPPNEESELPDSLGAFAYAWHTNASFVRTFPLTFVTFTAGHGVSIYEYSAGSEIRLHQMRRVLGTINRFEAYDNDPQMVLQMHSAEKLRTCMLLDIVVEMRAEGLAQIFYTTVSASTFSEERSQQRALEQPSSASQMVLFRLKSLEGFGPVLRFDPVNHPGEMYILSIRAYCRLPVPPVPHSLS